MGFIAFIIVLAALSAFFETIEDMSALAPYISVFLSVMAGYRFTRKLIAQRKAAQEEGDREELKEELRQEIKEEMRREKEQEGQTETTEEPYYPEVKYFNQ